MFKAINKKVIISLSIAAVMLAGGITAFAASSGTSLTPTAGIVDLVDGQMMEAEAIEGVVPQIIGNTGATTSK